MLTSGSPVGHEQGFHRPAIVISNDRFNQSWVERVVVVPLTRTKAGAVSHVEVEPGLSGLSETSYAKVQDVRSISTDRLIKRYGVISLATLSEISRILTLLFDLH
jgi:mRNA interferase MazF